MSLFLLLFFSFLPPLIFIFLFSIANGVVFNLSKSTAVCITWVDDQQIFYAHILVVGYAGNAAPTPS